MYDFYIDKEILPIPPKDVEIATNNMNKTIDLVNGIHISYFNLLFMP